MTSEPDYNHRDIVTHNQQYPQTPNKAKLKLQKFLLPGLLFIGTIILIVFGNQFQSWYDSMENFVSAIETPFHKWLENQNNNSPLILIPVAFVGGLIASISPCILSLLPVNLSYK